MNTLKRAFLVLAVLVLLAALLLAACGSGNDGVNVNTLGRTAEKQKGAGGKEKITICHKTDDPNNPYVELHLPKQAVENGHSRHEGDIIPAPAEGCPK
ncbi:MAG TPA: hypothetical protein PLF42_08100 [Anaerolineales bacterium]|nr:hypothetical protein [Anaerolineales bacterium]